MEKIHFQINPSNFITIEAEHRIPSPVGVNLALIYYKW